MRRTTFAITLLCLPQFYCPKIAIANDDGQYDRVLRLVRVSWYGCRFLGYLTEWEPAHTLLIAQAADDHKLIFPDEAVRYRAEKRMDENLRDSGLSLARKLQKLSDPEKSCQDLYSHLAKDFQVVRIDAVIGGVE